MYAALRKNVEYRKNRLRKCAKELGQGKNNKWKERGKASRKNTRVIFF